MITSNISAIKPRIVWSIKKILKNLFPIFVSSINPVMVVTINEYNDRVARR
ncbi:MAG: hypothetical protein RMI79_05085 [Nitrososphaerota archaeon]|nr:hypothetical protein [Nitrososphaerota archaeon]